MNGSTRGRGIKPKDAERATDALTLVDAHGQPRLIRLADVLAEKLVPELGFQTREAFLSANIHLLLAFRRTRRLASPKRQRTPPVSKSIDSTDIERALATLLRAIALAAQGGAVRFPGADGEEVIDGQPAIVIERREGCYCPCPDGVTVEFKIAAKDVIGPLDIDLFEDTLQRGHVENPPGQPDGDTEELEDDKTVTIDFGKPELGPLNKGDVVVTFTVKPFFKDGFDDDQCCITATGSFAGDATIASFTDRGEPTQTVVRGQTDLNESLDIGDCDLDEDRQPCCVGTFRFRFRQSFNVKALGFDVDSTVTGIVTVVIRVFDT